MISDEAVEAAAKVMQAKDRSEGFGEYELHEYRDDAREILEAAAPHMLAEAWDEGFAALLVNGIEVHDGNPHRSQS